MAIAYDRLHPPTPKGHPMSDSAPIFIHCEATDLSYDGAGWSANASWVRRVNLVLPADASARKIAIAIRRALDLGPGMRRDGWSGCDWSWRCGCVGAWAEVSHELSGSEMATALDPYGIMPEPVLADGRTVEEWNAEAEAHKG